MRTGAFAVLIGDTRHLGCYSVSNDGGMLMAMLESVMGIWIIASIISETPNVRIEPGPEKNLGQIVKLSPQEATFNESFCSNPKYSFHAKDQETDDHVKIYCPSNPNLAFPNLYAIDDQHIRAKLNGVNYELFRFEKKN